jgi:hypothetical protein
MQLHTCFLPAFLALLSATGAASAQTAASTIPMTLTQSDYGGGRIYLSVRMGNAVGTMRLDTGASTSRITFAPWNKDFPTIGTSDSTGASGRTIRCDDVDVKVVELKASEGNNIARKNYQLARCPVGDGDDLLGLDFFRGARFSLDFAHREIIFSNEAATPRRRPFRLLGPEKRLVGIDLRAGRAGAVGLFDTGAEISAVDQRFVDAHKSLFALVKSKGKASEAGGKRFSPKIYRIKEIDLGDGRIARGVHAVVYDFGPLRNVLGPETPFILGFDLIGRFRWDLDLTQPDAPSWDAQTQ